MLCIGVEMLEKEGLSSTLASQVNIAVISSIESIIALLFRTPILSC
jgi:hypothetical protein